MCSSCCALIARERSKFVKAKLMWVGVMALLAAFVVTATSQPPGKDGGDKKFGKKDKDGPPDGKGPPRWELGRVLPPFVVDQLDLSETQLKQLAELQKEVKAKVLKILTEEQRKQLENVRFPGGPKGDKGPPGKDGGPGGKGGPGGPGGKGDKKGPPPDQDISDEQEFSATLTWNKARASAASAPAVVSAKN